MSSEVMMQLQPITAAGYRHLAGAVLNDAIYDLQRPAQDRVPAMEFLRSAWAADLAALAIDTAPDVWFERVEILLDNTPVGVKSRRSV